MSKPVIDVVRIVDEIRNNQPSKNNTTMSELKEINCITVSRCNELVVIGSEHSVS